MDHSSIAVLYSDAVKALLNYRIYDALSYIRGILYNQNNLSLSNEYDSLRTDYEIMLHFMYDGGEDPQRERIHHDIIRRSFALLDKAFRHYLQAAGAGVYATALRNAEAGDGCNQLEQVWSRIALIQDWLDSEREKGKGNPSVTKQIRMQEDQLYTQYNLLFDRLFAAPLWRPDEMQQNLESIETLPADRQQLCLSALFLALWTTMDPLKYKLLLHFCQSEHSEIRTCALAGVVWVYMLYHERFHLYPELEKGISLLVSEPTYTDELVTLQKQLYLNLETARAERKMKEEILPDLIKHAPPHNKKVVLGEIGEDLAQALRGSDEPGKENKEKAKLARNMQEIMKMNEAGIDINMGTFAPLKRSPFYYQLSNWFWPFDVRRPEIRPLFFNEDDSPTGALRQVMDAASLCDSDRYSLCLMMQQYMPGQQQSSIMSQFAEQSEGVFNEHLEQLMRNRKSTEGLLRNLMQNLYRFFKLHPNKGEFADPFELKPSFGTYPALKELSETDTYLNEMADFLLRTEYYEDAATCYETMLRHEAATAERLRNLAYCYQKNGLYKKAIGLYQQADLLETDHIWTLTQMHLCYACLEKYEQQLDCLLQLEALQPDDTGITAETGLCLIQLNRMEEAAQRFYKLEFKGERVMAAMRAIAWCSLNLNKLDTAERYYLKLLEHPKARWEDYLNAGHTAWLQKDVRTAITRYQTYVRLYAASKPDDPDMLRSFDNDCSLLRQHGITQSDIYLMQDILRPSNDL